MQQRKYNSPAGQAIGRAVRFSSRAGDGARTHDSLVGNVETEDANVNPANDLRSLRASVAQWLPNDPDFARLAAAWPDLPEPIRRAVLAIIDATKPRSHER